VVERYLDCSEQKLPPHLNNSRNARNAEFTRFESQDFVVPGDSDDRRGVWTETLLQGMGVGGFRRDQLNSGCGPGPVEVKALYQR
jgi:hypothetical protein